MHEIFPSSLSLSSPDPSEAGAVAKHSPPESVLLRTAFQPIFSVAHAKPIGHEALLRGMGERGLMTAGQTLHHLGLYHPLEEIERTCARLHLKTFAQHSPPGWLFLNLSPEVVPDRASVVTQFGAWLDEAGVRGNQVVVEIVEKQASSETGLAGAIEGFRDVGCLIAIDDFGAGESNFERIWRIRPDLVKLDREMLTEACEHPHVRQLLPGIVSLLHEAGCLVVLEGIESEEQALIAFESDVDFVQGFYFGKPQEGPTAEQAANHLFVDLSLKYRAAAKRKSNQDESFFQFYAGPFHQCARTLQAGRDIEHAADALVSMPGVQRVYLLDDHGRQVGTNQEGEPTSDTDLRYDQALFAGGGDWFRRPYFQRAVARPSVLQTSRPYLSVRDARRCVTLSMALQVKGDLRVLCTDLDYNPGPQPLGARRRVHAPRPG